MSRDFAAIFIGQNYIENDVCIPKRVSLGRCGSQNSTKKVALQKSVNIKKKKINGENFHDTLW